jgi:hypothetical protein
VITESYHGSAHADRAALAEVIIVLSQLVIADDRG